MRPHFMTLRTWREAIKAHNRCDTALEATPNPHACEECSPPAPPAHDREGEEEREVEGEEGGVEGQWPHSDQAVVPVTNLLGERVGG